jgi:crossover junction endodeoxyribonuclease RuvC
MKTRKPVGIILREKILESTIETRTIIGIDPGIKNLGIGIININNDASKFEQIKGYGYVVFKIKQKRLIEEKLLFIFDNLCKIFDEEKPALIVVEDGFVGINKNSGLKLGIVRGAIFTAVGRCQIPLQTITPTEIKMHITNRGNAQKEEIQSILEKHLLNWPKDMPLDASDAIAAAICGVLAQYKI